MGEIPLSQLSQHLASTDAPAPVYLIFGQEYFYKTAFDQIIAAILPEDKKAFNLEIIDGTEDNIFEAVERVNTFALDPSAKVVGFCDTGIFYGKQDNRQLIKKIKTDLADDNLKKAGLNFQKLLGFLDIDVREITSADRETICRADPDAAESSDEWLDRLISYCRTDALPAAGAPDSLETLRKAVEKGFAPRNHLIITADVVDKRRKLYKTIRDQGLIVDCSVATGHTQADRKAQAAALLQARRSFEQTNQKKLTDDAFEALREKLDFDLRTFANNLDKLAAYVGDRETITRADVAAVLQRSKTDPIYELTNAVADRDTPRALFFVHSLLTGSEAVHPLQILAALGNLTRTLLVIKSFTNSAENRSWRPGLRFDAFKNKVVDDIERYDTCLLQAVEGRDEILGQSNRAKTQKNRLTDMVMAPNRRNLYPVFKNFEKAENFSETTLLANFRRLSEADRQLKSSVQSAQLLIEALIIQICQSA